MYRALVGKPEGNRPLGRPRSRWQDNKLRWIFRKWDVGEWTGSSWLRIVTGTCECGNGPTGSIKCEELLD